MAFFKEQKATLRQCNLISDLCLQLCINNANRKGMIETRFGKVVTFLDELTFQEAHTFINELLLKVDAGKHYSDNWKDEE